MRKNHIQLKESEKTYLEEILSKGKLSARIYKRCTALLMLDSHHTQAAVAKALQVRPATVSDWRKAYASTGLRWLITDRERQGRPLKITGKMKAEITALACSEPPAGYSQWSLRLLANKIVELEICEEISHAKVGQILKKMS